MIPSGTYDGVVAGPRLWRWLVARVWAGKVFKGYVVWNVIFGRRMILGQVFATSGRRFLIRYPLGLEDTLVARTNEYGATVGYDGTMVVLNTLVVHFTLTPRTGEP